MEPKIVQLPQIFCIGVPYYGDNKNGEIPATWPRFNSLSGQIKNKKEPRIHLGVETYTVEFESQRKWFYLAAVEVTTLDEIPVQLVGKILPANRYAVFTHQGKLPGQIAETFRYIYGEWLPSSGYKQAAPYYLERYDTRFKGPDNEESHTDICIPIQKN